MPYAKLNDLNMFYEEFGRGETVLFLHSHFSRGLLAFPDRFFPSPVGIGACIRISAVTDGPRAMI